jgi:penicillin-binding protein 1B
VRLHRVPAHLVDAVLVTEDRRFFDHAGIDSRRITGALAANLRAGRVVEGGSTLTQQLVKNLFLSPERSLERKLREAALALHLERSHGKGEILEAYLNEIYLGQRGAVAVHGVAAAARHYFRTDVGSLSPSESALLAGMIRGPSLYSPRRRPERALARRNRVLRRMLRAGRLAEADYRAALGAPLGVVAPRRERPGAYFVDLVRGELEAQRGALALGRDGLRIVTTLDWRLQRAAEAAVRAGLAALERDHASLRRAGAPLQAALVALDPGAGDVLALVGGRDHATSPFNRAAAARRQPGSLFKPVVALAAFARRGPGLPPLGLESPLLDRPLRVARPEGVWAPTNFDRRFRGRVSVREALEQSLNVPIARLGLRVGIPRVAETARRLGLESPSDPAPSILLGSFEVSLLEISGAYAVLAAEGTRSAARTRLLVLDGRGRSLEVGAVERTLAFARPDTRAVTSALRGAVEGGTGRRVRALGYRGPVAGKTGTTNGYRDAWFVGYTPDLVVGVWVGFDDGRSVGLPGAHAALPIFVEFLIRALGPDGGRPFPPGTDPAGAPARSDPLA